jgi:hypothetical protein
VPAKPAPDPWTHETIRSYGGEQVIFLAAYCLPLTAHRSPLTLFSSPQASDNTPQWPSG